MSERSARGPLVLARAGHFFVGGTYVDTPEGRVMSGQMYVRELIPEAMTHALPIVMVHGMGQTGTNFESTPDGREGWALDFVRAGYAVYVVDQPARGRSAYHADIVGPTSRTWIATVRGLVERFTAPARHGNYATAKLHTQWPGTGEEGCPHFDQFFASQVAAIASATGRPELLAKDALTALLDRIGPAILLTHSQSGAFGWQVADARPSLVRAILAIEPALAPTTPSAGSADAPYGITMHPLTYDPPLAAGEHLPRAPSDGGAVRCWLQAEPVRRIPRVAGIPIAIVVAEASASVLSGRCISGFLAQAGVVNEFINLADVGIHGNGHMMMLELNSAEIATFLMRWLDARGFS